MSDNNIIYANFAKMNTETEEVYYRIQFVALGYAYAVQTGDLNMASVFLTALREQPFKTFVQLPPEVDDWMENTFNSGAALLYKEEEEDSQ
jgi:hypothetical protein